MNSSIHLDMPAAAYHAHPAISSGTLRRAHNQSLAHVKWTLDKMASGDIEPESEDMSFGHLFHTAILEPMRFAAEYRPAVEKGEGYKAANLRLQAAGHKLVKREDMTSIWGMMQAIANNPIAQKIVTNSKHEVTVIAGDRKARLDMWLPQERTIVDLKYTRDASRAEFERSIVSYGYHAQGAHYIDVCNAAGLAAPELVEHFLLLCVEARPPYAIGIYELDAEAIAIGRSQNDRAYAKIKAAQLIDEWPDYSPRLGETIPRIGVPYWYATREADARAEAEAARGDW